jgi:glycosyltransferase involved in cell wall biosynthesis
VKQIEIPNASGLWNARNMGIQSAEHELIAVHDADDVMHPDRLKIQLDQILSAEIDVLGSPVYEFDAVNERVLGLRMLAGNDQLSKKMIWQNVINHSSVMLRKSAVVGVGGYRNVHLAEDYDLWLRLMCAGKNLCTSDFVLQAFSVDGQLNKRRGGTKFIASEFILHRLVRSTKLQNILVSWIRLVLRLSYRLGPKFSRQIHRSRVQVKQFKNSAINLEEFLNNPPLNINLIS